jgi:hypothetical protein
VSEPDGPQNEPPRVRRKRVRVKVEQPLAQKAKAWWRRRQGVVLIVGWFVLASLVLAALILTGHLKAPTPPPPSE